MRSCLLMVGAVSLAFCCVAANVSAQQQFINGDWTYTVTASNQAIITGYSGAGGVVNIPATIDGYVVSEIARLSGAPKTAITSVTIPDTVTSIGDYAFDTFTALTNVIIGNSVTGIGRSAFGTCTSLTSVTIPQSVTSIGEWAFLICTSLTSIDVDSANPSYSDVDGVLFNKSQTTLLSFPGGKSGAYTVPLGVTSIGGYAFYQCSGLTRVTIPGSVTSIGDQAFLWCSALSEVFFLGNAPTLLGSDLFTLAPSTIYYYSGASGWGSTFAGRPTVMLNTPPPDVATNPLVSIETVEVGNAGNPADARAMTTDNTFGYGSVGYVFAMGKYEVTISEYATFLNAAARSSNTVAAASLWQAAMETDTWSGGIARSGVGSFTQPYVYSVLGNGNRPITYVDWFDAARFCNWLHNGARTDSDTETGAYSLNGATNGNISRSPGAKWWIPSENEWYKAAYYDPAKNGSGGYWAYPLRKDSMVIGEGNFYSNGYAINGPGDNKLSTVGFYSNAASYYGTFDQAGNVWEWNDTFISTSERGIRGGGWPSTDIGDPDVRNAAFRDNGRLPTETGSYLGFRVAGAIGTNPATPASFLVGYTNALTNLSVLTNDFVYFPVGSGGNLSPTANGLQLTTASTNNFAAFWGLTNRLWPASNSWTATVRSRVGTFNAANQTNPWFYGGLYLFKAGANLLETQNNPRAYLKLARSGDGALVNSISAGNDAYNGTYQDEKEISQGGTTNLFLTFDYHAASKTLSAKFSGNGITYTNAGSWDLGATWNLQSTDLFALSVAAGNEPYGNQPGGAVYQVQPGDITLRDLTVSPLGFGTNLSTDTDGDGLSDLIERAWAPLGFDWQVAQPGMVAVLADNANAAGYFSQAQFDANRTNGRADVTNAPASFGLFTQAQFDTNRTNGRSDVLNNPASYNLYTSNSIMDLRMGGVMVQRQGTSATVVFQPQTTTDLGTQPFTNNGTPITNTVPMPGNKGFIRIRALPGATP